VPEVVQNNVIFMRIWLNYMFKDNSLLKLQFNMHNLRVSYT